MSRYLPDSKRREPVVIFFLVKVFEKKEHANDFVRGKLFARRLYYFKKIEEHDGRGDEYEGAIMPPIDDLTITLKATDAKTGATERFTVMKDDLAGPPVLLPRWFDHINVFCMYAAHSGPFQHVSPDNVQDLKKQIEIPEDCTKLGDHAVIITNISEFFKRVKNAAERKRYKFYRGFVRYYDPEVGTPPRQSEIDTIFTKRKEYEYQNEYRLAIDTGKIGYAPITLDIGRIDDITISMRTSEINRQLTISLP